MDGGVGGQWEAKLWLWLRTRAPCPRELNGPVLGWLYVGPEMLRCPGEANSLYMDQLVLNSEGSSSVPLLFRGIYDCAPWVI